MTVDAAHAIHAGEVGAANLFDLVSNRCQRRRGRFTKVRGPASKGDEFGELTDGEVRGGRPRSGPIENSGERNGTIRDAGLKQRHGTHADASDPACAGVSRDVVRRHGGSGENELPRLPAGIDGPPPS